MCQVSISCFCLINCSIRETILLNKFTVREVIVSELLSQILETKVTNVSILYAATGKSTSSGHSQLVIWLTSALFLFHQLRSAQRVSTYLTCGILTGGKCCRRWDGVYNRSQAIHESITIYSSACKYSRICFTSGNRQFNAFLCHWKSTVTFCCKSS